MNDETILGGLDPDVLLEITTRRGALAHAGRWGIRAAMASVPLAIAGLARGAFAQGGLPANVVSVLNFALMLGELEAELYVRGMNTPGLIPASERTIFGTIRDHEVAHVRFLRDVLGSQAAPKPTFVFETGWFREPFRHYYQFLVLAQVFEDIGVRAYKGQAPELLGAPGMLRAVLTIHSVEARHASEVRRLRGEFTDKEPKQGWVTLSLADSGVPLQRSYDGDENLMQAGINISGLPGAGSPVGAHQGSESFDEPLTRERVLELVDKFIVPPA